MPANFQKTVLALLVSGNNVPNQFVSGVCSYSCEGCYRPECDRWRSDLFGEEGILQTFPRHPSLSHGPGIGVRIRVSGSGGSSRWPGGALWPPSGQPTGAPWCTCSLPHCPPVPCTCFTLEGTRCTLCTQRSTLCHTWPGHT